MDEILKLRVIDLGEKRVVQVLDGDEDFWWSGLRLVLYLADKTVDQIKEDQAKHLDSRNAQEGEYEPPIPRLERSNYKYRYYLTYKGDKREGTLALNQVCIDSLEQIIGHKIPIYEPRKRYVGEWRKIEQMHGLEIWDYSVTCPNIGE